MEGLKYYRVDVCRESSDYPFKQWITYNVHIKHEEVLREYLSAFTNRKVRYEDKFVEWCKDNDIDLVKITRTVTHDIVKIGDLTNDRLDGDE